MSGKRVRFPICHSSRSGAVERPSKRSYLLAHVEAQSPAIAETIVAALPQVEPSALHVLLVNAASWCSWFGTLSIVAHDI
jgi:hypothetical protein